MEKQTRHFEKLKTTLAIADAEHLDEQLAPENSFDAVFGNCVLQIVNDPEQTLRETYRVLAPGGRAGFTTWGSKENSDFMTVVPKCLMKVDKFKEMMVKANVRSLWHLSDPKPVLDFMESIGFKNCRSMELFTYSTFDGENCKDLLWKHTEYSTYDLRIKLESDEDKVLLHEVCVEAVDKMYSILNDERRPIGFYSMLYWGDK